MPNIHNEDIHNGIATGLEMVDFSSEDEKVKKEDMETLLKENPVSEEAKEGKEEDVYTVTDVVEEKEETAEEVKVEEEEKPKKASVKKETVKKTTKKTAKKATK